MRGRASIIWGLRGVLIAVAMLLGAQAAAQDHTIDFSRDVRPILSQHCFKCHGADDKTRKAKLRFDQRESAVTKGAIVPGKPGESELVARIFSKDDEEVMPPPSTKQTLTEKQKQTLAKWIEEGAEYQAHWAFVAPVKHQPPVVRQQGWVRNPIDRFVLSRLEKEGLKPSAEADHHTLVRRLYLDLIGLPTTVEEADAFAKDDSPDAYEKLVDRLLASPQYGERWARKWLDLARYADTNGYEKDRKRSIWAYRDWVINAINADMPFDQFTIEQLAGDMLPNATMDQLIGTGFHRNTMLNEEGGIDPLEYRYHAMVDRIGTTGTVWLGLTVACAQCHTHKFDPITHNEYFGLMAYLNNADEPELEIDAAEVESKRREAEARIDRMIAKLGEKFPVVDVKWSAPELTVEAESGQKAQKKEGAWVFEGKAPDKDVYTISFETKDGTVDRLKLEVLTDGKVGPGLTPHGNFVLSEVVVSAATGDGEFQTVKIAKAEADHSQNGFAVSKAIDGSFAGGWAVDGQGRKDRTATFHLDKPARSEGTMRWKVALHQLHGTKHSIARFRLSAGEMIEDARPVEVRRKEAMDRAFAVWEASESAKAVKWTVVRPAEMKTNMPLLTQLPDGSILASGDLTKSDTYDLLFKDVPAGVTAIRLEALPHESLPKRGPGLIYYEGPHGDFYLSEISIEGSKIDRAVASFEPSKVKGAIDGDQQSGWSINGGQGQAHYAVFALEEPTKSRELKLRMLFERYYAAGLGRFRISVTTDPKAREASALPPEVSEALALSPDLRSADQRELILRQFLLSAPELAEPRKEIEQVRRSVPAATTTLVMRERPKHHPRETWLYNRGEFLQPKEKIQPALPAFLQISNRKLQLANRLEFARWLVSPENPLTARVTVNRQWHALFGGGLVKTIQDFGYQGELPSHPELLDWLAIEFMDQKWSMKKLHRLIVTSATYRQSSKVSQELLHRDPENVLLARGARFRPDAEILRDAALKASGLLSLKMGGPSVFPPQPPSITTEGAYGPLEWKVSTGEDRHRRSLYTFMKRTAPFALFSTLDAPSGEACVVRREVSNTPLQALSVMNDQVFVEAHQALGAKIAKLEGDDGAKAADLFQRVLTRPPALEEKEMLVEFARKQRKRFERKSDDAEKIAGKGDGSAVERAVWTLVARSVMNLDEATIRN